MPGVPTASVGGCSCHNPTSDARGEPRVRVNRLPGFPPAEEALPRGRPLLTHDSPMPQPRVLILRAPGTNCDKETAHAFERAGAAADVLHVNRLLEAPERLDAYQVLCVAGGFSYGDDLAAGRILASQFLHHLADPVRRFVDRDRLVLGICNGFQVLIKSGILVEGDDDGLPEATLTINDSGRFEDRWVELSVEPGRCVFLQGIRRMYLPVAHAEGKFVPRDDRTLADLADNGRLVLRYLPLNGGGRGARAIADQPAMHAAGGSTGVAAVAPVNGSASRSTAVPYPDNPNGSVADVAGICDTSGRVLGLMPHPERHVHPTQHPRWTRGEADHAGDGLAVFQNAVRYFA